MEISPRVWTASKALLQCAHCNKPNPTLFVVKDELWRSVYSTKEERDRYVCLVCFEERLGRELTFDDLKPCGNLNAMYFGLFLWDRVGRPKLKFDPEFLEKY